MLVLSPMERQQTHVGLVSDGEEPNTLWSYHELRGKRYMLIEMDTR